MRPLILALTSILAIAAAAVAQAPALKIKTLNDPDPVFPPAAANYIYGETVRVAVQVDKEGKVTAARPVGPLTPCADRKDKAVFAIQKAAVEAAKATVFEPILKDGKPQTMVLYLNYRLRPDSVPLPKQERTITGAVLNGKAKRLPAPIYSSSAKIHRISGSVELLILINENGRVLSFSVISGDPLLAAGTFDSVCRAEFEPALLDGKPAKVIGTITYNFVL